jgi:hypothetical protein
MNRRSRVARAHTSPATTSADGMSRISIALLSTFEAMTSIMADDPEEGRSEASAQRHQRIAAKSDVAPKGEGCEVDILLACGRGL